MTIRLTNDATFAPFGGSLGYLDIHFQEENNDHGDELFETIEGMVLRRDVLGLFRDGVTVAIDGVGAAAEVILSARLWNHIDTAPRLVPIVRVAPPDFDKDRRPDIANVEGRFVFEIVPPGEAHQAALRIMARRLWV